MKFGNVHVARSGKSLWFIYQKWNPADGAFFDDSFLSAASITVKDLSDLGSDLVSEAAMTFSSDITGYVYEWVSAGTDLTGVDAVYVVVQPTRVGVPAALSGPESFTLQVTDLIKGVEDVQASIDDLQEDADQPTAIFGPPING